MILGPDVASGRYTSAAWAVKAFSNHHHRQYHHQETLVSLHCCDDLSEVSRIRGCTILWDQALAVPDSYQQQHTTRLTVIAFNWVKTLKTLRTLKADIKGFSKAANKAVTTCALPHTSPKAITAVLGQGCSSPSQLKPSRPFSGFRIHLHTPSTEDVSR